jgi:hypothetical protein
MRRGLALAAVVYGAFAIAATPRVTAAAWRAPDPLAGSAMGGPGNRRLAQTWEQLTPDQRAKAMQNFQRYQRLPEKGRERLDRRYQQFQGLPPGEQDRLRQTYDAYRKLSPDQKRSLTAPHRGGSP